MTDIKSHIEAIRSIFKKRFSGEFTYFDGSKSPDIFKGKDDLEENFDWKNYGDELDKFDDEIYEYIDEKKLNSHTVEEIMKNFKSTDKNFDKKIAWEILLVKKLYGNMIPKHPETRGLSTSRSLELWIKDQGLGSHAIFLSKLFPMLLFCQNSCQYF